MSPRCKCPQAPAPTATAPAWVVATLGDASRRCSVCGQEYWHALRKPDRYVNDNAGVDIGYRYMRVQKGAERCRQAYVWTCV